MRLLFGALPKLENVGRRVSQPRFLRINDPGPISSPRLETMKMEVECCISLLGRARHVDPRNAERFWRAVF